VAASCCGPLPFGPLAARKLAEIASAQSTLLIKWRNVAENIREKQNIKGNQHDAMDNNKTRLLEQPLRAFQNSANIDYRDVSWCNAPEFS
jgi:hypothetical protein